MKNKSLNQIKNDCIIAKEKCSDCVNGLKKYDENYKIFEFYCKYADHNNVKPLDEHYGNPILRW